jgi:hypothetical protein
MHGKQLSFLVSCGAALIAALALGVHGPQCHGADPDAQDREDFSMPLTDAEARMLLDVEEGRRFRKVFDEPSSGAPPGKLPPHLRAVQRSLGGSLLEQFDALQPAAKTPWWKQFRSTLEAPSVAPPAGVAPAVKNEPYGRWPRWSVDSAEPLVPATAESPAGTSETVAALRATAADLDAAANRLEHLELYQQSDALRELAQRMRVDARQLTTNVETAAQPGSLAPPRIEAPSAPGGHVGTGVPAPDMRAAPGPADPRLLQSLDEAANLWQRPGREESTSSAEERSVLVAPGP